MLLVPKKIPFDVELYVGVPATKFVFRPFPDLSFHCVTFEPDKTIDVVSAPSNHSAILGVVVGEIGNPVEKTSEVIFDIELADISTV